MNTPPRQQTEAGSAGFTLIEGMITFTVFAVLLTAFIRSFDEFNSATEQASREYQATAHALEAMQAVTAELERSAFVTLGGVDFPRVFEVADLGNLPGAFAHAAASNAEGTGTLSTDLVYALPLDGDGDGWPDLSAAREPVWDPTTYAFVLVPDGQGTNNLERRSSTGDVRTVARHVASMRLEDPPTANWQIPLESVRIRLETAVPGPNGERMVRNLQTVVRLLNGRFDP